MAKFRNVSVKFWSDPFIETLTPDKKLFFLYLITNEHATQCGIYEISLRLMAFETGYKLEAVEKLIEFFEGHKKIKYSRKTNEVAIKNFVRHNPQGSPKVKSFVEKELLCVKDRLLIAYIYDTDTVSQVELEEEETKEEEQTQPAADAVTVWPSFEDFWQLYDKNNDKPKCLKKWEKIKQGAREKIMEHLALYVHSTPDLQFRKNPYTYLNNESWNNEIIIPTSNGKQLSSKNGKSSASNLAAALQERINQDARERQFQSSD